MPASLYILTVSNVLDQRRGWTCAPFPRLMLHHALLTMKLEFYALVSFSYHRDIIRVLCEVPPALGMLYYALTVVSELSRNCLRSFIHAAPVCAEGSIRVLGSYSPMEGRVEYCYNAEWHSVCSDTWNHSHATVVCSSLGYSTQHGKYERSHRSISKNKILQSQYCLTTLGRDRVQSCLTSFIAVGVSHI